MKTTNFAETIKAAKAINKSGAELKKDDQADSASSSLK